MDDRLPESLRQRYQKLLNTLSGLERCAVAYSGGVDSTFLLQAAARALGENAMGITVRSELQPQWEQHLAEESAAILGVRQEVLSLTILSEEKVRENGPDRCYFCKKALFSAMLERAKELGYAVLLDGTNVDDQGDYRPGQQAARELGVISPLLLCGYTKQDIRETSRELGLLTHDLPSYACLASRIPYHTPLEPKTLHMVEQGEDRLRELGFRQNRLRVHGDLVRIEVEEEAFSPLLERRKELHRAMVDIGFSYVTLDLKGFSSGSMNIAIGKKEA